MGYRENKIEAYLNEQVNKMGGVTRKWVCPGRVGVPDRIVFVKGVILFVEIKTEGGVISSSQRRELKTLSDHGALVGVVVGREGVDEFIRNLNKTIEYRANKDKR